MQHCSLNSKSFASLHAVASRLTSLQIFSEVEQAMFSTGYRTSGRSKLSVSMIYGTIMYQETILIESTNLVEERQVRPSMYIF